MGEECKPRRVKLSAGVAITAPYCNLEIMQLVGYIFTIIPPPQSSLDPRAWDINRIVVYLSWDACGFIAQHHDAHA